MYTPDMMESIRLVEKTRPQRMGEQFPRLAPSDRESILKDFHPDHRADALRPIRVGASAGSRVPHELADVIESRSRLLDAGVDLDLENPAIDVDVLIIGGGGAGCAAALMAKAAGATVTIVTKLRLGDANTMMAQGGIQAATKDSDAPAIHYLDVMGGGGGVNVPSLVRALVWDAPSVIKWLESLGCMLSKDSDGTMQTIHGGGTSRKRMHFARDYTGAEIMRTLRDEVHNRHVDVLEFCAAVELMTDEGGQCCGGVVRNMETREYSVVRSRCTILATGGFGRLHVSGFPTTNHYGATADGLVLGYRAGVPLVFLEATQFHPTGVAHPEQMLGQLVTEKVRSLGAQLANVEGKQFIYPLETRDVVSSAIIRECKTRRMGVVTPSGQDGVWLDSPMIEVIHGPGTIKRELPAMYRQYSRFNIDMTAQPILTYPTLHYQNGGLKIDEHGRTVVPNLFAAGEVSGGVHGRNRLMGNSLLDILVFGRRAGAAAAARSREVELGRPTLSHAKRYDIELEERGIAGGKPSPVLLPDYTRHVVGEGTAAPL